MDELNKIAHLLPFEVLTDIKSRLTDWIASGGSWNDPYIKQQVRYAKRVAKRMGEMKDENTNNCIQG
ncbi:hypothetical protein AADZ13_005842 [Bacillus cereus]|uniref:DUF6877 domain-containing protein n=1 Tax=Bacillus thuringiensis TaxID=1428 RepID=A0A9X5RUF6_BACTU|nr:DUF6877 family protein [Bacillus thuringiensis]EKS7876206.1 hypothetical protein [Bacillus cereus]OFC94620.1 hypothetical protein BTGOE4_10100 [Bacillus thuringiensis]